MRVSIPTNTTNVYNKISEDGVTSFSKEWFIFFENIWRRLLGELNIYLGGVLNNDSTAVGNVGAGTDDLITYSLSGNNLRTSGDFIEIDCFGTFAANANNKVISLVFGSTTIFTISPTAINSGSWNIKAKIIRTGSAIQEIIVSGNGTNAVLIKTVYTSGAETLANSLDIKCTAIGTSNDDILQKNLTIKIYRQ